MDLNKLCTIAIDAALAAGALIEKQRGKITEVYHKNDGENLASKVLTEADLSSEQIILSHLSSTFKQNDLALLSEETTDDGSRFVKNYFWCIDPLDGTLPFIENRSGYSVSIALVSQSGIPVIGVVFDPDRGILYHAIKGQGAFKNHKPWKLEPSNKYLTYVTDKQLKDTPMNQIILSILKDKTTQLNLNEFIEISGGGSVLNAIRVLENPPACLIKMPKKSSGGGSIWDFAATICLFNELGMKATNFNGGVLDLNQKGTSFMNLQGVFFSSEIQ